MSAGSPSSAGEDLAKPGNPSESTEMEEGSFSVTGSELDADSDLLSVGYDRDNDSVASLTRRSGAKKHAYVINRLKAELAQTRNALAIARGNDIVMLRSKLRAAESDLNRVRIQNIEFKENIEQLELRLFEALAANRQHLSRKSDPAANKTAAELGKSTTTNAADPEAPTRNLGAKTRVGAPDPAVLIQKKKYSKLEDILKEIPLEISQQIQLLIQQQIESASAADRKTISELIKELHRLEVVAQEAEKERRDVSTSTESLSNSQRIQNKSVEASPLPNSNKDAIVAFFVGAVLMLLSCVIVSIKSVR
jgi:hypothetical protein